MLGIVLGIVFLKILALNCGDMWLIDVIYRVFKGFKGGIFPAYKLFEIINKSRILLIIRFICYI